MSDQPANSASEVPRGSENVNPQKHPCFTTHSHKWERQTMPLQWECHHRRPSDPRSRRLLRPPFDRTRIRFSADLGELSINFGGERYMLRVHRSRGIWPTPSMSNDLRLCRISVWEGVVHERGRVVVLDQRDQREINPKKVNFSDSPDHQLETEDELNDQWFSEMTRDFNSEKRRCSKISWRSLLRISENKSIREQNETEVESNEIEEKRGKQKTNNDQ
ncbi:unnamed protein product, partial [Trichogramma brassicae]